MKRKTLLEALCWEDDYEQCDAATEIREMCRAIDYGTDPEELLHERGLEADYVDELLSYYSDYMDERTQDLEEY